MLIKLEIVSLEKKIFEGMINSVILPTPLGETGILPLHIPLVTSLVPGELRINHQDRTDYLAVSGGFAEVHPDRVLVLVDAAEHAEEIDLQTAEEARKKAVETMKKAGIQKEAFEEAAAELRRSLVRLKVARKKRKRGQF